MTVLATFLVLLSCVVLSLYEVLSCTVYLSVQTRTLLNTFLGTTTVGVQLGVVHPQLHPLLIAGMRQQEEFQLVMPD